MKSLQYSQTKGGFNCLLHRLPCLPGYRLLSLHADNIKESAACAHFVVLSQHLNRDPRLCLDQFRLPSTALDGATTSRLCRNPRKSSPAANTLAAMRNIVSYLRWSLHINRPSVPVRLWRLHTKATTCRTEPGGQKMLLSRRCAQSLLLSAHSEADLFFFSCFFFFGESQCEELRLLPARF